MDKRNDDGNNYDFNQVINELKTLCIENSYRFTSVNHHSNRNTAGYAYEGNCYISSSVFKKEIIKGRNRKLLFKQLLLNDLIKMEDMENDATFKPKDLSFDLTGDHDAVKTRQRFIIINIDELLKR